jgi:hypothetical protein
MWLCVTGTQIHFLELTNIRLLHTKFSHRCDLLPRICASLLSFKCIIQMCVELLSEVYPV